MNWSPILSGAIGGILVTLAGYVLTRRGPRVDPLSRQTIVCYGVAVQVLGVVLTLLLAAATIFVIWKQPDDYHVHLLLGAFCVVGGSFLLLEFFGVRIEFDSESVRRFAPWHRPKMASWDQVARVTYSASASWHVLHTSSGKIRVPDWMAGSRELVEYARRRAEANKSIQPTCEDARG
jgi:hypothetical protein